MAFDRKAWNRAYRQRPEVKLRDSLYKRTKRSGVTKEELIKYSSTHSNTCDICKQPEKLNRTLSLDHCHKTGTFRGLLCANCNRALGLLKDDVSILELALNYLKHSEGHGRPEREFFGPGFMETKCLFR
jgi:hypothetical protein